MAVETTRTLRGAVAGALAAGVWALQQPLDKRIFGSRYDDVELLGKLVTRGRAWPLVGFAWHLQNGALFGAVYANVAPLAPLPSWSRGPLAGLAEHLATWPSAAIIDRVHPARNEIEPGWGSWRPFAQATWRHLLFGTILGEVERRLNPQASDVPQPWGHVVSSNGHGNIEHAAAGGTRLT